MERPSLVGAVALLIAAVLAVVSIAFLGLGGGARGPIEAAATVARSAPEVGALAPGFVAADGQGSEVSLSDYRGRAVLVHFWTSWCHACRSEMPAISAIHEHHRADGFEVVAVNVQDSAADAKRVLPDIGGGEFQLAFDQTGTISRDYRVVSLPASFFIDRRGVIRAAHIGQMSIDQVERFTHQALAGAPTPVQDREPVPLTVLEDPEGPGTLYLLSPVIRCSEDFCANHLLLALHAVAATREARGVPQGKGVGDEIPIFVRYDPALGGPEEIVAAFHRALKEIPDPKRGSDLSVRYLAPIR